MAAIERPPTDHLSTDRLSIDSAEGGCCSRRLGQIDGGIGGKAASLRDVCARPVEDRRAYAKMKAPPVDYIRPRSLTEALDLLANAGAEGRVIAGGQSLLALMNLRLAAPALLIDIARLPELAAADEQQDTATLGAGVTHARIEDGRVPDPSRGLMPHAAASLGYRAIRNRGTIGGSLALADP